MAKPGVKHQSKLAAHPTSALKDFFAAAQNHGGKAVQEMPVSLTPGPQDKNGAVTITLHTTKDDFDEKAEVKVELTNPDVVVEKMLQTLAHKFPPESVMTIATGGVEESEADVSASTSEEGSEATMSTSQAGGGLSPLGASLHLPARLSGRHYLGLGDVCYPELADAKGRPIEYFVRDPASGAAMPVGRQAYTPDGQLLPGMIVGMTGHPIPGLVVPPLGLDHMGRPRACYDALDGRRPWEAVDKSGRPLLGYAIDPVDGIVKPVGPAVLGPDGRPLAGVIRGPNSEVMQGIALRPVPKIDPNMIGYSQGTASWTPKQSTRSFDRQTGAGGRNTASNVDFTLPAPGYDMNYASQFRPQMTTQTGGGYGMPTGVPNEGVYGHPAEMQKGGGWHYVAENKDTTSSLGSHYARPADGFSCTRRTQMQNSGMMSQRPGNSSGQMVMGHQSGNGPMMMGEHSGQMMMGQHNGQMMPSYHVGQHHGGTEGMMMGRHDVHQQHNIQSQNIGHQDQIGQRISGQRVNAPVVTRLPSTTTHHSMIQHNVSGGGMPQHMPGETSQVMESGSVDGHDMPVKYIEVPIVEEKVIHVPKMEYRHVEKRVPKYEYETVERIVEVPQVKYVDKEVEVPRYEEVLREVKVPKIIDVPKAVIREVPKYETKIVEKNVEVPGPVIEVPKVQQIEQKVNIPRYVDKEVPTVVAQKLEPVIFEVKDTFDVPCTVTEPRVITVDVFIPKPVQSTLKFLGRGQESHTPVNVPPAQFNALTRRLNMNLEDEHIQALLVREGEGVPMLPAGERVEAVEPVSTEWAALHQRGRIWVQGGTNLPAVNIQETLGLPTEKRRPHQSRRYIESEEDSCDDDFTESTSTGRKHHHHDGRRRHRSSYRHEKMDTKEKSDHRMRHKDAKARSRRPARW